MTRLDLGILTSPAARPLLAGAAVHACIAVVCVLLLLLDASPITGVHPAAKPLKFAASIALLLATLALVVPRLSVSTGTQAALGWVLAGTLAIEMVPIVVQAVRGTTSHFNQATWLDAALWRVMFVMIVAFVLAFGAVAVLAIIRPLGGAAGLALDPVLASAIRIGLALALLIPLSGFAMGGRGSHGVGGADGGPGLPLVGWSTTHGDLRVPHFFAMHGLQLLPAIALIVLALPLAAWARWLGVVGASVLYAALCVATLVQALAGRPFLGG